MISKRFNSDYQMPIIHRAIDLECTPGESKAFLSASDLTDTAVVFVHGFKGNPIRTWVDFPGLADAGLHADLWDKSDLFFFDYMDVTKSIDDIADDLGRFLNLIYPHPSERIEQICNGLRGQPNETPVRYDQLILVGHSEGGVVIRACITELGKRLARGGEESPVLKARLALFAPALYGFLPTRWLGLILQFFPLNKLMDFATSWSTPGAEMRDVVTLEQIRRDSENLSQLYPDIEAFSAHVVFGEDEQVVRKQRYFQDIKYPAVPGKDHMNICKPSSEYQEPLSFVRGEN